MKYCLSGRQPLSALRQADEIKMKYQDRERAIDYIKDMPNKTIIIDIPKDVGEIEWKLLDAYNQEGNLILCLYDLKHISECLEHKVKYYWAYPITSYYELQGLLPLYPCYLYLGAPLSFDLMKIKSMTNIDIRLCPNIAYGNYIPRRDGVCGHWIRPEDVKYYEPYVTALEFIAEDLEKERTLLHIYKDNQNWPGNLNLLLTNFGVNVDNRALPDELGPMRISCGQRCMINKTCHYCENAIKFAEALRHKHFED